jgi:hypothetical protein
MIRISQPSGCDPMAEDRLSEEDRARSTGRRQLETLRTSVGFSM